MKNKENKLFFSPPEVAKLLGISRATVLNKIKKGLLKADRIGKYFIIPREEIEHLLDSDKTLSVKEKDEINKAVERAIKEYGQAIRMLGKE